MRTAPCARSIPRPTSCRTWSSTTSGRSPPSDKRAAVASLHRIDEPGHEAPSPTQLAHRQHELIRALAQREVHRVILRIHDAEERRIAEILRAAAAIEDPAVEGH